MISQSDPIADFQREKKENISALSRNKKLLELSHEIQLELTRLKYSYNFTWLGRPIIQLPQDILALQEIVWNVKPNLIIETGIAHGGSLIFHASLLELLGGNGQVLGIDLDIRKHNRELIEQHPMFRRITMIEGSSTASPVVEQVKEFAKGKEPVLLVLDSNHTHDHVFNELRLYSPLVTKGSYIVVLDTDVEDMPEDLCTNRPWGKGNNPKTAVREFLTTNNRFEIDREMESKLVFTVAPEGYLKCIKENE